jgi:NAD(P)H-flavin reductase
MKNTTSSSDGIPPWHAWQVPTKLLKKTTILPAIPPYHLAVYTLTFEIPDTSHIHFTERAQPHSQTRLDMGHVMKMVIPNYKPKSYSVSDLRETEFDITFKAYPNGRASGYLNRLEVGDFINTFSLRAKRRRNPGTSVVGIIAFGVGITEALPVARAELEKGDAKTVKLVWASRTMADTFWHDKIQQLEKEYPEKFEIIHVLSREEREGTLYGRLSPERLKELFVVKDEEERSQARFLPVGTKEMMATTDGWLTKIGFPMPQHHLLPKQKQVE